MPNKVKININTCISFFDLVIQSVIKGNSYPVSHPDELTA